jgi:cellulose synthase/poly-beta-1,6-N-acetylglucosamine synthase-like glycosyltransferase
VESLLNIKYPDSEIIVINDGSTDKTLDVLISHFDLKKTDVVYRQTLQTKKIRGIYKNKFIPELTVIDKVNGGKADSLNAGVNLASKEYVLGTDSDCILERDSLLKLTAPFIDEPNIVIASGGAIVPANGCAVENGAITECHIPGGSIPKLQTLEYFRAFMTGRLGWSKLKNTDDNFRSFRTLQEGAGF